MKPAASLEPIAMPSIPLLPSDNAPASAVTSPSFITTTGTFHSLWMRLKMPAAFGKSFFGTARSSDATRISLSTMMPAELPPMASTRGRCAAARCSAAEM